jgi:hypothetical protein
MYFYFFASTLNVNCAYASGALDLPINQYFFAFPSGRGKNSIASCKSSISFSSSPYLTFFFQIVIHYGQ